MQSLSKSQLAFFIAEINKFILKLICKEIRIAKTTLKKRTKVRGLTFPDFKIYSKATLIKTVILSIKMDM